MCNTRNIFLIRRQLFMTSRVLIRIRSRTWDWRWNIRKVEWIKFKSQFSDCIGFQVLIDERPAKIRRYGKVLPAKSIWGEKSQESEGNEEIKSGMFRITRFEIAVKWQKSDRQWMCNCGKFAVREEHTIALEMIHFTFNLEHMISHSADSWDYVLSWLRQKNKVFRLSASN